MHDAATGGHLDAVKLLIKNKAKHNVKDENGMLPIHYAASSNSAEIIELLIKEGSGLFGKSSPANSITNDGRAPLHFATGREAVHMLLKYKANVGLESTEGYAPLHDMALRGDYEAAWAEIGRAHV